MVVPAGHHHLLRRPFEVPLWHLEGVAVGRFRAEGPKPHAAWPSHPGKIAPFGAIFPGVAPKTGLKARFGSGRRFRGPQNGPRRPVLASARASGGPPGRPSGPAWSPVEASSRGPLGPWPPACPGRPRGRPGPPLGLQIGPRGPIWPHPGLQTGPRGPIWLPRRPAAGLQAGPGAGLEPSWWPRPARPEGRPARQPGQAGLRRPPCPSLPRSERANLQFQGKIGDSPLTCVRSCTLGTSSRAGGTGLARLYSVGRHETS